MANGKKGGLGTVTAKPTLDDPLDALFGGPSKADQSASVPAASTPELTKAESSAVSDAKPAQVSDRVLKSFRINRELAIRLKVYAAQKETSGDRIVEAALRKFFAEEAE